MSNERNLYSREYTSKSLDALGTFAAEVECAFKAPSSDPDIIGPREKEQWRYVLASAAVAKLAKAIGLGETASRFALLSTALERVADGLPDALFMVERPKAKRERPTNAKGGGRRDDPATVWQIRCTLCLGLKFLMAGGDEDSKVAIGFAVNNYRSQLAKLFRPRRQDKVNLNKTVDGWMKQFANDRAEKDALENYKNGIKRLATAKLDHSGKELKQAGESLIAAAAERAARLQ